MPLPQQSKSKRSSLFSIESSKEKPQSISHQASAEHWRLVAGECLNCTWAILRTGICTLHALGPALLVPCT